MTIAAVSLIPFVAGVQAGRQPASHAVRVLAASEAKSAVRSGRASGAGLPHGGSSGGTRPAGAPPSDAASTYRGLSAKRWHAKFVHMRHLAYVRGVQAKRHWRPTVDYALTLASRVSGVPYRDLYTVAHCESTLNTFAVEPTGRSHLGLFQLSWRPFGFSPFDPVANALSAALTVVHDGGWRQWQCKP